MKKFLKFLTLVLVVATVATISALSMVACGGDKDTQEELVIATETGFAPFEYKNGNKLYGIDMAIMAEIAKKLDKKLVVQDMAFSAVVTSVQKDLCDVAAAALTITDERKEAVNFSKPYYQASQVAVVKADNTKFDNCKTAADVEAVLNALPAKTKAAFQAGTTGDAYIKEHANLDPKPYDKVGLAATDLINGNVEVIIVDKAPAEAIVKSMNKGGETKIKAIAINLTEEEYAFGVSKSNPDLLAQINKAYDELKADGTIDSIMNAYFNGGEISEIVATLK